MRGIMRGELDIDEEVALLVKKHSKLGPGIEESGSTQSDYAPRKTIRVFLMFHLIGLICYWYFIFHPIAGDMDLGIIKYCFTGVVTYFMLAGALLSYKPRRRRNDNYYYDNRPDNNYDNW